MKTKIFTLFLALVASAGTIFAWGYERVQIGDLYYNLDATNQIAYVTYQLYNSSNNYSGLTTTTIPSSVEYNSVIYTVSGIQGYAFMYCSNLTNIEIPNSVTSIGQYAFYNCDDLMSIEIPNGVKDIGDCAFADCTNLTSIVIPNSVTRIGNEAFSSCSSLPIVDNIRYADTYLVEAVDKTLSSYTIKEGTRIIGVQAFSYCSNLTDIDIPKGIISIFWGAFEGCTNLTNIKIPDSITNIEDGAFAYCSSLPIVDNIRYADTYLVEAVDKTLSSYTIKEGTRIIGNPAFANCSNLTDIDIPNSVICLGNSAFYGCSYLKSIKIPNSVTSIGEGAFKSCRSLIDIIMLCETSPAISLDFVGCPPFDDNLSIYVPCGTLDSYLSNWWYNKGLVRNLNIGYMPLSRLGYSINGVTFPSNAGSVSFSPTVCDAFVSATPNYGYHFKQWSDGNTDNPRFINITQDTTFTAGFERNEYTITTESSNPEWGVTTGDTTVLYQEQVEISAIPNYGYHFVQWSEEEFVCDSYWNDDCYYGHWEIYTDPVRTITVTEDRTYTAIFAKNIYTISDYSTHGHISGNLQPEYLDSVSLTAIPDYGYHFTQWSDGETDNPRMVQITQDTTFAAEFGIDSTGICGKDFALTWEYNRATKTLTISGDGSLTENMRYGVEALPNMEQLIIGDGVYEIGWGAFYNTLQLKHIIAPAAVLDAYVSEYGFNKLETVYITSGALEESAFGLLSNNSRTLIALDLSAATNTSLPFYALQNLFNLRQLQLPAELDEISYMAVAGCKNLKAITIPASVKFIEQSAFEDCRSITALTFEEGSMLKTIGSWAFYNCHELAKIELPEGVEEIGKAAFYGCAYAQEVHLPASVKAIGDNGFALCSKIKQMNVDAILPPDVEDKTFYEVSTEAPVYVPDESVDTYKSHAVWGKLNIKGRADAPTGIDNTSVCEKATKILRNGQILIQRGDKTYTVTGQEVR